MRIWFNYESAKNGPSSKTKQPGTVALEATKSPMVMLSGKKKALVENKSQKISTSSPEGMWETAEEASMV